MKGITGITVFDGKSKLNNDDIIVVATLNSENVKTGNLVQTWILPKNISPLVAVNLGKDSSTCACNLRGYLREQYHNVGGIVGITHKTTTNKSRVCYVSTFSAPQAVWHKFHRGEYPFLDQNNQKLLSGRKIRLSSVGDPSAVPSKVWKKLLSLSIGWTGYTHNWKNGQNRHLKSFCQASTNLVEETKLAWSLGWKTFRISKDNKPLQGEIVCPASKHKVKCEQCMLCNGQRVNVMIKIHGTKGKIAAFNQLIKEPK
uniref:Uncharacterized protein n=1 Tax=viral metagenome TaxID=1070528 RepID=A0A6M3JM89_9ZZZZ